MAEYRTGNHWGVTIVREPDGDTAFCCNRGDHPGHTGAKLVAVVVNGDTALAERICALLNGDEQPGPLERAVREMPQEEFEKFRTAFQRALAADSCTCTIVGPDPACPVHQGRRARGPKPPPVGPGCICDGSGRTCPRHGAVI